MCVCACISNRYTNVEVLPLSSILPVDLHSGAGSPFSRVQTGKLTATEMLKKNLGQRSITGVAINREEREEGKERLLVGEGEVGREGEMQRVLTKMAETVHVLLFR